MGERGAAVPAERDSRGAVSEREQKVLRIIETARSKRPRFKDETVTMAHGAGGKATQTLIEGLLVPALAREGETLEEMGDAGVVTIEGLGIALSTDSYVVRPIRFPGGSIGELAVNGTANDLAVAGARPQALSLSLILEEGLPADELRDQVQAIATAAEAAGVEIATGDTKVVERGHADGMYICTAGIGKIDSRAQLSPRGIRPGDRILVSGTVGDHGSAIMLARDEFSLDAEISSDTRAALARGRRAARRRGPRTSLHARRDPRRGGVGAERAGACLGCRDQRSRGRCPGQLPAVAGAAEMLGIDPMYVANEGKLVAFVAPERAQEALAALRSVSGCEDAAEIGEVKSEPPGMVLVETAFGGKRVMDQLVGDPLPRIC